MKYFVVATRRTYICSDMSISAINGYMMGHDCGWSEEYETHYIFPSFIEKDIFVDSMDVSIYEFTTLKAGKAFIDGIYFGANSSMHTFCESQFNTSGVSGCCIVAEYGVNKHIMETVTYELYGSKCFDGFVDDIQNDKSAFYTGCTDTLVNDFIEEDALMIMSGHYNGRNKRDENNEYKMDYDCFFTKIN